MNASKCDVCGRFYIPNLKETGKRGSTVINRYYANGSQAYFSYDLCFECTEKLDRLLGNVQGEGKAREI